MNNRIPTGKFYLVICVLVLLFVLGAMPLQARLASGIERIQAIAATTAAPVTPTATWDGTPFTATPTLSSAQETQTIVAMTKEYQSTAESVTLTVIAQKTLGEPTMTPQPTGTPTWDGTPYTDTPTVPPSVQTQIAVEMTATRLAYFATETAIAIVEATLGIPTRTPQPTETAAPPSTPTSTFVPTPLSTPIPVDTATAQPTGTGNPTPTFTPTHTPTAIVLSTIAITPNAPMSATIGLDQGLQAGQEIEIGMPENAVSAPLTLNFGVYDHAVESRPAFKVGALVFDISAEQDGAPVESFTFAKPITLTITYRDEDIAGLDEEDLELLYYHPDNDRWETEGIEVISRDTVNNRLVVTIAHLTTFGLMNKPSRLMVPLISSNSSEN